ncbi:hypothetical protein [Actinoplanes sp. NPDC051851]|uniref:hypothetical protein n=1 Tax=Actinoplanes sp. NPDC051851 TaxID=3154753 RepID=UPI003433D189
MALSPTSVPGQTKVVPTAATPSATETISANDIGDRGLILVVTNGSGASINVTIADPGTTAAGNAGAATAQAVATATKGWFRLLPAHVNPNTQLATVTFSAVASVTVEAVRA